MYEPCSICPEEKPIVVHPSHIMRPLRASCSDVEKDGMHGKLSPYKCELVRNFTETCCGTFTADNSTAPTDEDLDDEDLDATIPVATATAVTPAGGAARRQATASSQQETRRRSGNTDSKLMALDPLAQTIQREAASSRMDTFVQEIGKFCGKEAWDMRAKYCFIASENLPWNLPDAWWDDLVL